ncbi:MAG: TIM-barrel domain-containing protein [Candidatus Merdivicinus sp.]|jgi:alpha-D-xyloside xylohydrolase
MCTEMLYHGVWKVTVGEAPQCSALQLLHPAARKEELNSRSLLEFPDVEIRWQRLGPHLLIELFCSGQENFYGTGLQFSSMKQNGKRKQLRVNADPPKDTGDSHAPVPLYFSNKGYGILVDSLKNVEIDFGATAIVQDRSVGESKKKEIATDTDALYQNEHRSQWVRIYIRNLSGVDLYVFRGNTLKDAVERYNLFCGGGFMPPIWGLGNLYRCYGKATQKEVEETIEEFAKEEMPFTMIGLEPGWQTHAYSCSYRWDPERFPHPEKLMEKAENLRMRMNLWEQGYVAGEAECYPQLRDYAGNYEVWKGLVPDFTLQEAKKIWGERQQQLIRSGIAAFKLDECDGADYTGGWYFPDFSIFPSGLDGEEMKNVFGALLQRTVAEIFAENGLRTFGQVRANYLAASSCPFALYSDLYNHEEFVRGICSASFSGLTWSPEVREAGSENELIRRIQTVVFSPFSCINAWMIPHAPWKQYDLEKNRQHILLEHSDLQNQIREILKLRNQFIPYLYEAYYRYYKEGTPVFRAMAMDYPDDENCANLDQQYMMGDCILVAPILKDQTEVYLPEGIWYDFWTQEKYEGGQKILQNTPNIPVFVKENHILLLANGENITDASSVITLTAKVYGPFPQSRYVVEDDFISTEYKKKGVRILSYSGENLQEFNENSKIYQITNKEEYLE